MEDMSLSSALFFCGSEAHIVGKKKTNPHICYTNTACGTKNKTHTDENDVLQDIILDLILRL